MIDNEALALRAVACKAWRWMPRMRAWFDLESYVILQTLDPVSGAPTVWTKYGARTKFNIFTPEIAGFPTGALPDLADPATLGCLLALVREAYAPQWTHIVTRWGGIGYYIVGIRAASGVMLGLDDSDHLTEAAALVAALEAAPDREVKS